MNDRPMRRRVILVSLLGLVILAGGTTCWLQRTALLAWYTVSRLTTVDDRDRDRWIAHVVELDAAAQPSLLRVLGREDERSSQRAALALTALVQQWTPDDARRLRLAEQLVSVFPKLSAVGQVSAMPVVDALLQPAASEPSPQVLQCVSRLLAHCGTATPTVRTHALSLVDALLQRKSGDEMISTYRELVLSCLRQGDEETRVAAIRLTLRPELSLLEAVAPLLHDPRCRGAARCPADCRSAAGNSFNGRSAAHAAR